MDECDVDFENRNGYNYVNDGIKGDPKRPNWHHCCVEASLQC